MPPHATVWINGSFVPADGPYDFEFTLYDAESGGDLIAGPLSLEDEDVAEGIFTVTLDFGIDAFALRKRWLLCPPTTYQT